MNPYQLLIQRHALPLLGKGEKIEASARVYTDGVRQRLFVAAATSRRIILVEMKSGLLRIKPEFAGVSQVSFGDVERLITWSFLNLKHIVIGLRSGEPMTLGLNNLTARMPGQEHFFGAVRALYSRYKPEASSFDVPAQTEEALETHGFAGGEARSHRSSSLPQAIAAGSIAAILSAAIWATISIVGEAPIALMALGVGMLVGSSVRAAGRGTNRRFGIAAGVLALVGCVLGRFLWAAYFFARGGDPLERLVRLVTVPAVTREAATLAYGPSTLVFYLLAGLTAYGLAFRRRGGQAVLVPEDHERAR